MKDSQIPHEVPAASTRAASSGHHRSGALAIAVCLALAGVIAWLPAASARAGQASRPAHAGRTAGLAQVPGHVVPRLTNQGLARPLGQAGFSRPARPGFGSALAGSAPVGRGPSAVAVNAATHTIYVANGNNDNGPNAGGNTVSVIDDRHCNAQNVSRCKGPWPTITVGDLPAGVAIDQKTGTVYVIDAGASTVSVFNGATCNALDTSGCGQTPATVPVGPGPLALFDDPADHTVYIANCGSACQGSGAASTVVSMLDTATCNATDLAGCPATPPPTFAVGATPIHVVVDQASHTVYVTTFGDHPAQNGWAVLNARTCNAVVQSGCGRIGRLIGDPAGPNAAEVDPANRTLYTANFDNTISAFSLRHCHAGDLGGCSSDKPGTVTPFPGIGVEHALFVAVDVPRHSVYVSYQADDALVVVDTGVCNGSHPAGCAALRPPTIHTGADPQGIALNGRTQTLYTANEVDNTVSVISAARCNAQRTSGCRHPAPAASVVQPGPLAADPAVHTTYVTSGAHAVSMIDTRGCSVRHLAGCTQTPAEATVGTFPAGITIDRHTHTVYVANFGSGRTGTVSVLDARTCNATSSAGCATRSTLKVPGGHPEGIAINAITGTLYVPTLTTHGPDLISVFNAATCNAATMAGCGQAPAALQAGPDGGGFSALSIAVNQATDTVYAADVVTRPGGPFRGHSVSVFNGATCNGTDHTGCGQTPATVSAGANPLGIAVDAATDTIYTANVADGEHPGTASVINGATCNGTDHTGCGQTPATVRTGYGAAAVAVDPAANMIYVTNFADTSVSVIDGNTCNGLSHTGCGQTPPKIPVGNYPGAIATDSAVGTAYVANLDNTVSVVPLTHRMR
jgi:DNA-binding beta-propeller fold protein YncE